MKFLLDTHLLLWVVAEPTKLSEDARSYLFNPENEFIFSAASIWEITIKAMKNASYFLADAAEIRQTLLGAGYEELSITSSHALAVKNLPPIHGDPFDRILIAQAQVEEIPLLSQDSKVQEYLSPVIAV